LDCRSHREFNRDRLRAGGQSRRSEAQKLGQVVPGSRVGRRRGRRRKNFADHSGGQEANTDFVRCAVVALVASENGAADDAHVARSVGLRLENRFVGQDMVHDAPAPGGRLKRQIIVWLGPHGLAVHFDLNGVDGGITRTKTQLFAVLAGCIFHRAVAEFDEKT